MAGALSKRQQARNERTLQELIKTVPGNNVCADCQARNPGWASWSLGIFLCMRCAALHRKLGTHISKVKSLSMDSWTNDQVETMKKTGNIASNRIYNPQNTKPPIPFDADEADAAMERFIRQKYMEAGNGGGRARAPVRHDTGSTESDDQPPPLPPKTGSKFGFRSASSIFPMSSKAKREAAAKAHLEAARDQRDRRRSPSPPIRNKPSRVFSTELGSPGLDDLDSKLATLRQMGFQDERRNATVLKGLNGNIEKAIEALVRLGESDTKNSDTARSRTPLSASAGISIQRFRDGESPRSSNNPFDMPSAAPQSSQSTGTLAQAKAQEQQQVYGNRFQGSNNSNPFGLAPSQSQYSLHQQYVLDQSFQNLSMDQSQPLFPNHTGGFPNRQPFQAAPMSPMPTIPQNYTTAIFDSQPQQQQPHQQQQQQEHFQQFQQQQQQQPPQNQSYNPFLQQQQSPITQGFNGPFSSDPATLPQRAQTFPQQTYYDQSQQQQVYNEPHQQLQNTQQQQVPQQQLSHHPNNPFGFQPQQIQQTQSPQQQMPFQNQQQQQQLLPQQTVRADKSSILALYNYPQPAPSTPSQPQSALDHSRNPDPSMDVFGNATAPSQQQQLRSTTNPLTSLAAGSRNPFLSNGGGFAQGGPGNGTLAPGGGGGGGMNGQARHVSQESMSVDMGGWHGQNGRHSPDAFANLSARSIR